MQLSSAELHRGAVHLAPTGVVALCGDFLPLNNLSVADVLEASNEPSTLLTSNQNDRFGFTDGFVAGNPLAVAKVLGRLDDVLKGRLVNTTTTYGDFESGFKESFVHHGIRRVVTCMRFVKVRAHGGLDYTRCLDRKQWLRTCSPDPSSLPDRGRIPSMPRCPTTATQAYKEIEADHLPIQASDSATTGHHAPRAGMNDSDAPVEGDSWALSKGRVTFLRVRAPIPRGVCMQHDE